jgi:hypothetical protein
MQTNEQRALALLRTTKDAGDRIDEATAAAAAAFHRGDTLEMWLSEYNFHMSSGTPFRDLADTPRN